MANFNAIDIAILGIFIISILMGLMRGLLREVLSLLTWITAFIIATLFSSRVAADLFNTATAQENVDASHSVSMLGTGVSFAGLFIATLLIGWLIIHFISSLTEKLGVSFINRFLGGLFGLARGFLIVLAGIFLVELGSFAEQAVWQDSRLVKIYQPTVQWLDERVEPGIKNLKEKIELKIQHSTTENSGI
jgi:membrane protein required for colicin V production